MLMNKQDAFARFGSYLSVQVGGYDVISETLGSYEEARKNNTIGDDTPYDWYFPNTVEGLAAAKEWALECRIEERTNRHNGIKHREGVMNWRVMKIRILRAKIFRDKAFLKTIVDYNAETAAKIIANETDTVDNVEINLMQDELELGTVLDIGTPVYFVTNDYGGVKMEEHKVTSHSIYGWAGTTWTSDGEQKPTVDIVIHSNYGDRGHIENDCDPNKSGYTNQKSFFDKDAALEQARVWAQELIDKNSKWL